MTRAKDYANRPSQADQEFVINSKGNKVRNLAYNGKNLTQKKDTVFNPRDDIHNTAKEGIASHKDFSGDWEDFVDFHLDNIEAMARDAGFDRGIDTEKATVVKDLIDGIQQENTQLIRALDDNAVFLSVDEEGGIKTHFDGIGDVTYISDTEIRLDNRRGTDIPGLLAYKEKDGLTMREERNFDGNIVASFKNDKGVEVKRKTLFNNNAHDTLSRVQEFDDSGNIKIDTTRFGGGDSVTYTYGDSDRDYTKSFTLALTPGEYTTHISEQGFSGGDISEKKNIELLEKAHRYITGTYTPHIRHTVYASPYDTVFSYDKDNNIQAQFTDAQGNEHIIVYDEVRTTGNETCVVPSTAYINGAEDPEFARQRVIDEHFIQEYTLEEMSKKPHPEVKEVFVIGGRLVDDKVTYKTVKGKETPVLTYKVYPDAPERTINLSTNKDPVKAARVNSGRAVQSFFVQYQPEKEIVGFDTGKTTMTGVMYPRFDTVMPQSEYERIKKDVESRNT